MRQRLVQMLHDLPPQWVIALAILLGCVSLAETQDGRGAIANLRGKLDENAALHVNPGTVDTNIINVPSVTVSNLVPTSAPTYAVSPCGVVSAASTNATSCADAPANWYGVYYAINTTADPAFIRVFNTASAPADCTAAVTIAPIAVPARSDTAVYGGVHLPFINPINFTTGFGFCVTGAADGTTNAPAGVLILMGVKE